MQNTSPSSFELVGVSATEEDGDIDRPSLEAARDEAGVGDDLTLAAEFCVLSLELGSGLSWVEGVTLGDRGLDLAYDGLGSESFNFVLLFVAGEGFGLASPFFFEAAEEGLLDSIGAGRFLPAI